MRFAEPWYLLLLTIIPIWVYLDFKRTHTAAIRFSDTRLITKLTNWRSSGYATHLPFTFRILAVLFLVIALARPQSGFRDEEIVSKGIDIMLTLDLSSSMTASDLAPDRLTAAKRVLASFIDGRKNDRIGLVVFAARGYTQCPLTLDYSTLQKFLDRSKIGLIEDGTAIGMAVATATNRLKDSEAKSKVAVLLTDGLNNRGAIDPMTAARIAKSIGVKVYTIGVGKEGVFYQTITDPRGIKRRTRVRTEIDEKLLANIADITGGKFFRARDEGTLAEIYNEIDRLEKTDIKTKIHMRYTDYFFWFIGAAIVMLIAKMLLPLTPWRVLP